MSEDRRVRRRELLRRMLADAELGDGSASAGSGPGSADADDARGGSASRGAGSEDFAREGSAPGHSRPEGSDAGGFGRKGSDGEGSGVEGSGATGSALGTASAASPPSSAPLSSAQRRMWTLQRLDPQGTAYTLCAAVGLSGPLDTDAFLSAVSTACARHEILRTVYPDAAAQIVRPDLAPAPELIDLPGASAPDRAVADLAADLGARPFDLAAEAPIRLRLLRFAPDEHALLLVVHHIAWDDASWRVLLTDIADAYAGQDTAPPALRYADHAAAEAHRPPPALDYWRDRLTPVPEPLRLPLSGRAGTGERGARRTRVLPADVAARLTRAARAAAVTPFMLLTAATAAVLYRYTGADDIALGTPVVDRSDPRTADVVGNFGNTLVLRCAVDGTRGFADLLAHVRQVCTGAYAHADAPFDRLVGELAPDRTADRSALFDVLFSLRTDVLEGFELPGVRARDIPVHNGTAQFDLALAAVLTADGLTLEATHRTPALAAETADALLRHTDRLLRAVLADPELPLDRVDILGDDERDRVLRRWNDTGAHVPATTLPALLADQVERTPDAVAVVHEGRRLTYAEFDERTDRLAAVLRALGVGPERTVALLLPRSVELVTAIWAVLKAGGAYLPVDPGYPADRIAFMIDDAAPQTVLTFGDLADLLPERAPRLLLDSLDRTPAAPAEPAPAADSAAELSGAEPAPVEIDPLHPAYVIYTSGSTGRPKGVVVPHAGIVNRLLWMQDAYGLTPGEPVLQKTPSSFDVSVWEFCWPLLTGATLVVARPDGHRDPAYLAELIRAEGVTTVHFVPSMLRAFLADPTVPERCAGLRRVLCSGEALPADLAASFHRLLPTVELHNLYGPTEASVDVSAQMSTPDQGTPTVPIGRPVWNTALYVLDRNLAPVPPGAPGELYIAGAQLARAYLGRPDLTAQRFVADPYGPPGARMYRTGDIARFDHAGALEYLGRADDQVKLRGLRIELGEIEAVLSAQPGVRGAAVAVRDDRLVGYLAGGDEDQVREGAAAALPDYMVPGVFHPVDELPLSPSGKLDRGRLATDPAFAPVTAARSGREPRTDRERLLCSLFAEVLRLPEVSADDRFFGLGGDSVQAITLVGRARSRGLEFTPREVFEQQTPAGLAALARSADTAAGHAVDGVGPVPPTPIAEWLRERSAPGGHRGFGQTVVVQVPAGVREADLARAVQAVLDHHDALRARLVRDGGPWWLDVPAPGAVRAEDVLVSARVDAGALDTAVEEHRAAAEAALDPDAGATVRLRRLDAGPDRPGRLVCTAHHLVVDAVSWRILLGDLAAAHAAVAAGEEPVLDPVPTSLRGHAQRLADRAARLPRTTRPAELTGPAELTTTLDPSDTTGAGARTGRLPLVRPLDPQADTAATTLRLGRALDAERTRALLGDVPGAFRTGTEEVLLTALVLAAAELRRAKGGHGTALAVHLEGHGRDGDDDLTRTVGWFTRLFPVLLDPGLVDVADALDGGPSAGRALRRVKEALAAARRSAADHGLRRYLLGEDTGPAPEVAFNYLGRFTGTGGDWQPVSLHAGSDPELPRAHALELDAVVLDHPDGPRLTADWSWPEGVLPEDDVRLFADTWVRALDALAEHAARGPARLTPSDVPLSGLNQAAIDTLTADDPGLQDVLPLTPLAEGLLYHAAQPGADPYVVQFTVDLDGTVDEGALRSAVRHLLLRHPVLRTAFRTTPDGRPVAVVTDAVGDPLRVVATHDPAAVERAERDRPFDVAAAPLLRLHLLRGPVTRLVLTCHHLILDGWSLALLLRELLALYAGADLAPAPDHRAHPTWLAARDAPAARRAWERALDGAAPTLIAPVDATAPPVRTTVELPGAEDLAALCARRGWTLTTLLQGAWGLLLAGRTGRDDVVFGTAVSGRPADLPGAESMIGLFTNTVPVRVRVRPGESAAELLDRLQAEQAALLDHQHLGLAELQRGHGTLFDTLLVVENYPDVPLDAGPGLRVLGTDGRDATHYPLGLTVIPRGGRLTVSVDHRAPAFDDEAARTVLDRFAALIAAIAEDADRRAGDLDPWTDESRAAVPVGERTESGPVGPDGASARDPREAVVRELFADVLGVDLADVGPDDDFFTLGGHSLLGIRLAARLRSVLAADLPVAAVLAARTPARIAAALGGPADAHPEPEAADRGETEPLSFAQERLWFLHRLEGPSPAYNIAVARHLAGPLDTGALDAALADTVERHESLRTVFPEVDGTPVQVLRPGADTGLDVRSSTADTVDADLTAAARYPFVLAAETPLRATLFRLGEHEHVLLLTVHHIAADGWSLGPLLRDLARAYAARRAGRPPEWEPLPLRTTDHARWQREVLAEGERTEFWRSALKGLPEETPLPLDRPRPRESRYDGGLVPFAVDDRLASGVRAAAAALGASPFMVWQAALAALLTRAGAGTDIPVGTPVAGRLDTRLDDVVGLFVNTLVLRTDTSGDPAFRELLDRVRRTALAAYEHQEVPFERVVDAVDPARSTGRNPLFQVMLAYQNTGAAELDLPGVRSSMRVVRTGVAQVDLTFTVVDGADGMAGFVEYRGDLFDRATVEALAAGLTRLVESVLADVDAPLSALDDHGLPRCRPVPEPHRGPDADRATGAEQKSSPHLDPDLDLDRAVDSTRAADLEPEPELTASPEPAPRSAGDRLRAVFADVLGLAEVGPDEGFFALGGDSIGVIRMVGAARSAGLRIDPAQVFEHQTPARLAAVAVPVTGAGAAAEPQDAAFGTVPETPALAWLRERAAGNPDAVREFAQTLVVRVPEDVDRRRLTLALQAVLDRHDALRARLEPGSEWTLHVGPPGSVAASACLRRVPLDHACAGDREPSVSGHPNPGAVPSRPGSGLTGGPATEPGGSRVDPWDPDRVAAEADRARGELDPERGHVFRAVWLDPGLLVLTAHHLAVDAVSWRAVLSDLRAAWDDGATAPRRGTSLRGWARTLRERADGPAVLAHLPLWRAAAADPAPLRLIREVDPARDSAATARGLTLPARDADALRRTAELVNGRLDDVLLTALALAVRDRAHGRGGVLLDLEGHGRDGDADLSATVGWFTSFTPVRLDPGTADPTRALKAVKEQLRALPEDRHAHSLLRRHAPDDPLRPRICFNHLGRLDTGTDPWTVAEHTVSIDGTGPSLPARYALDVDAVTRPRPGGAPGAPDGGTSGAGGPGEDLTLTLRWPVGVLAAAEARALADALGAGLDALAAAGQRPDTGGHTPSDLALVSLDQDEIDEFEAEWSHR
ncbi:non-ribosomal peptide synthase protein (TIGR01720 family)/amino acid adenylation domain-containing protein [Nocardiopsis sp. Huas11]|uniref:non-ribosomal peptide synthetase n=1 Tax=Nocardiopsis sp. Huas11 TaxID=2183912 RepID=UPI000EAC0C62|nr:non-ribosomal peptide synthetase [Nocardiopsis sp. Huas11]RKS05962.1 non-ribosomal peptide synthase protein (TIGR01720 family)/amino acid adenylation domain-containing protein [Nocardiopsis sp. Huas11]